MRYEYKKKRMTHKYDLLSFYIGAGSSALLIGVLSVIIDYYLLRRNTYREFSNENLLNSNENLLNSYAELDSVVIDYLKNLKITKVLEMCTGNNENAQKFRDAGFEVIEYDLHTLREKDVFHGVVETVEDQYLDHLLYLGSGIDGNKLLSKYTGKYILIGGCGISCSSEEVDVVQNINCPEEVETLCFPTMEKTHEGRSIKLECRPNYKWMVSQGFRLMKLFFIANESLTKWNNDFFVQQLWVRI